MTISGAIDDLRRGLGLWPFFGRLGLDDIRQRYARTALGPFWMILSSSLWIFVMAMVTASLFGQDLSVAFPFVAAGMYAWLFISVGLSDGCTVFIAQQWLLVSHTLPISFHLFRYLVRATITILHYIPILLLILIVCGRWPSAEMLWSVPALAMFIVLSAWLGAVLGVISMRYRDVPHIVTTVSSALPIVSPIAWDKELLKSSHWLADLNPIYHFVEIFRAPLLGKGVPTVSWMVVIAINALGVALGLFLFARSRTRLAMWT